ncbi:MAG: DUF438 domain-containing protein [Prolixibacteraceae bacterium]|nr:DUF438 domain-containing protein [Prolixibacteraceae bacterium]
MSELINNSDYRKQVLKELILKLHMGTDPKQVKNELRETLKSIPYGEVVEVEQELIAEGLPEEEVLELCDVHGEVLDGSIDQSGSQSIPEGHPVDVFVQENKALDKVVEKTFGLLRSLDMVDEEDFQERVFLLQGCFNELMDIDKHYQRKEYLVFPYLEKHEITGLPKVMWGKHDEIRDHLKGCLEILHNKKLKKPDLEESLELIFYPVLKEISDMVKKEEDILFPMAMDTLTEEDWWNIHQQTLEIGFTLYDPQTDWEPESFENM